MDKELTEKQAEIIKTKDAIAATAFAKTVEGADIAALQKIVIDSGNPRMCLEFAEGVAGADIKALEAAVIKSRHSDVCFKFAYAVTGANADALLKVVKENAYGIRNGQVA